MEREFIAFISYRHTKLDSAVAKALHTLIEQYRIPKDIRPGGEQKLGLVFRDQEELHASSDLSGEIQEALANSEYLIVICSENTLESPWVSREIGHFLENHDRDHILTVLASGEPMEVFPEILTHVEQPDGSVKIVEPLALDIREASLPAMRRKLRREIPRLIAPLLDCPYDALVLREQRRKFHRFTAAAALVLAVVLTFTSMVVAKNREIAGKNTELARQKAEIQLRESELLTQDAREALDAGNYLSAIENAASALPKSEDPDRPYYAPAEGVLMDALNVFHAADEEDILSHRDLTQITEIADFGITADGARLVTVDGYGTITCFDTASTGILWQTAIPTDSALFANVLIADELSLAIAMIDDTLAVLDLATGAIQWQKTDRFIQRYLFYHPETGMLAYAASEWTDTYKYHLIFADVKTGEEQHTMLLAEYDSANFCEFSRFGTSNLSTGGIFSEDGSRFLGVFVDEDDFLHCFRADLTSGRCDIIYRHATPGTYEAGAVTLALTDSTLRIAATGMTDSAAMTFLEIDPESGQLLRQYDVLTDGYYFSATPFAFFYDSFAVFALYDHMVLLDLQTGEVLHEVRFFDRITHLQEVDNRLCFCLADGTCGLAWVNSHNQFALTTDAFLGVSADLEEHQSARVWGHGIIQLYTEGNSFALGVANLIGPGYVAVIPGDAANTVRIFQPIALESPTPLQPLFSEAEEYSSQHNYTIRRHGNLLLIGPVTTVDPVTRMEKDCLFAVDAQSLQILNQICIPEDVYFHNILPMPDGTGFVNITSDDVSVWGTTGNQRDLLVFEDFSSILCGDEWWYVRNALDCAAGYTNQGTQLITVWCDMDTLTVRTHTNTSVTVSLPEHLVYDPYDEQYKHRQIYVGENGWIFVSLHDDYDSLSLGEIALYDLEQDTWVTVPGETQFAETRVPALAKNKPLFAWPDMDSKLHIYDLTTGKEATTITLQTPTNSISQLEFLLDDTCILVQNEDHMVFIYDVTSGALLFQGQNPGYSSLTICPDAENQRLYLFDTSSDHHGLCLDLRSWTVLTQTKYGVYFDAETNRLFCDLTLFLNDLEMVWFQVPGTAELVQTALDLIG